MEINLEGLDKDGGISFKRKKNFGEKQESKVEELTTGEQPQVDKEYLERQARLEAKLVRAKRVNYSGFAFNGSTIFIILFGVNQFITDPTTLELINFIEWIFKIEIPYEKFIKIVELWKTQIISLCGSIQMFLIYYQQTRQRMKNADTEDTWSFLNEELSKVI